MGLFGSKKKKADILAAYEDVKMADLTGILDEDELDLLATDFWSYGKMRPDIKELAGDMKVVIKETGSVPADKLGLCVEAVDAALRTFAAVGMRPDTHVKMLEKLKQFRADHR